MVIFIFIAGGGLCPPLKMQKVLNTTNYNYVMEGKKNKTLQCNKTGNGHRNHSGCCAVALMFSCMIVVVWRAFRCVCRVGILKAEGDPQVCGKGWNNPGLLSMLLLVFLYLFFITHPSSSIVCSSFFHLVIRGALFTVRTLIWWRKCCFWRNFSRALNTLCMYTYIYTVDIVHWAIVRG